MNRKIILSAISAVLALSASTCSMADTSKATTQTEKCYGISKAGVNDCASGANSCAGSVKTDGQRDAYLLVPTGLCAKIVGGSLEAPETTPKKS